MDITSISINTNDGKTYYVPIHSKASQLESVVKDALLKHLLYKADSERAVSKPIDLKVDIHHEPLPINNWHEVRKDVKKNAFEGCTIDSLMSVSCAKKHNITNVPLARGSSRYQLHLALVNFFYRTNNKWIGKQALAANMTHEKKVELSKSTIHTYLSETVGYGLLQDVTEVDNTKSLRLNPLFITKALLNN